MNNDKKVQFIFTRKHYINLISSLIVWFSGFLFIVKNFESPLLKIISYSVIFFLVIFLIEVMEKYYKSFLAKNHLFLVMLILTAASILLYRFDYIGYPSIAGFTIFWLAVIYQSNSVKIGLLQLAIFLMSPVLYSEAISFSGIFSLSMLIIVSILLAERFLEIDKLDWKFFLIAFLFGVTLSANILVGFVHIVYFLYRFRNDFGKGLIFVLMMSAAYALLLFIGDKEYITIAASHNLFQFLPIWILIFLAFTSFYIGWIVADLQELLFASGIILFCIYLFTFIYRVIGFSWNKNEIDFSLLIMALPFLILSIKEYKVDRFLGKIIR